MYRPYVSLLLAAIVALCLFGTAFAAEPNKPVQTKIENTPAAPKSAPLPVAVELEGTDTIGAKLAFQLKESFNGSSLFTLTDKEQPKIKLLISTAPEFSERPAVGSAYVVVWVYYERSTAFASLLTREVGTVTLDDVPALVTRLVERTSGLGARYGYLFE